MKIIFFRDNSSNYFDPYQTKTNKIDWRIMRKIGLETCFDWLKIRITRGRSISFKCSTRRNSFDCPCKGSTIYPCKIKSPVTLREYHLSLGIRGSYLAPGDTQRGYVVTSCRRRHALANYRFYFNDTEYLS